MKAYKEGNSIRVKENGKTILSYSFKTGQYKGDKSNYDVESMLQKKISQTILKKGPIDNTVDLLLIDGGQVSIQQILNGRMSVKGIGYQEVEFSNFFKDFLIRKAIEAIGGRKPQLIRRALRFKPQHWALERIFINKYRGETSVTYCAGQDAQWELNDLRKYLYNI